ncbi:MAG TPA: MGMT family protein [Methanobacterium sp.]|nr:MGMT family protein [Methanobacterium sp.]
MFLPTSCRETLYEQISHEFADFELTEKYLPLVKDISKIYNGQKANINQDILELSVNKTEPLKGPVPNEFDLKVLQLVLKIPKGEVKTYKEVAESLDSKAWRAVGSAMARNPFPLLIPCHRVVKSDLTLGNYGGGVEMKKKLLKNEGVMIKGFRVMKK